MKEFLFYKLSFVCYDDNRAKVFLRFVLPASNMAYYSVYKNRKDIYMGIQSDFHLHSHFSGDCSIPMEDMIRSGIEKGLSSMCFTEHNDFDFPYAGDMAPDSFILDVDSYFHELSALREKYGNKIKILSGVEIGVQECCLEQNLLLAKSHDFDFIIASSHLCMGEDPYYPSFFEGKAVEKCYLSYFEEMLANIRAFQSFDVYGHLDYIARYAPKDAVSFRYGDYRNLIDEILKTLIENGRGIECNTSGLRKPLNATNPGAEILKRYKELGGEIITVGSDAHLPSDVAAYFDTVSPLLKQCGFSYYATFERRHPIFHRL